MRTRHLCWVLIGPSFAVYLKTNKTTEGQSTIIYSYTEHVQIRWEQRTEIPELCFYVMLVVKGWAPTPTEFSVHTTVQGNKQAPRNLPQKLHDFLIALCIDED